MGQITAERHPAVAATADARGAALAGGIFFLGSSSKGWICSPSSAQPLASPFNGLKQTLNREVSEHAPKEMKRIDLEIVTHISPDPWPCGVIPELVTKS